MYGFQQRPHQAPPAVPPDDASVRGFRPSVRRDLDRAENESTRGGAGLGFRAGGLVRGPGTGTSDSVKTSVPEGTYIMPADSTQQIGPEALSAAGFHPGSKPKAPNIPGMGFGPTAKVPVNLSNGEFRLSPEQVHAIGVQVLEGLKAATHKPAEEGTDRKGDDRASGDLFFADGGLVEDPNKRPLATSPTNTYPGNQAERAGNIYAQSNADLARGFGGALRDVPGASMLSEGSQTRMVAGQLGDAWNENADKGNFARAAGATLRGATALIPAAMEDSTNATARRMQPAVEFGKGLLGIEDAKPKPAAPAVPGTPATAPAVTQPASPAAPAQTYNSTPAKSYMDAGPVPYTVTPVENTNGVQRINQKGQAPLFTNIDPAQAVSEMKGNPVGIVPAAAPSGQGMGFQPNGIGGPDVMGILQRESQIRASMTPLRDEIAFNGGNGIGFRKRTPDEAVEDLLYSNKAASRIAALKHLSGRQEAADQQENEQRQLAMKVQDALNRQNTANEELGLKREAQGFQTRAARRQEELQARYEAAKTPEERNAIAQQIRDLSGREPPRADSEMVKARMNLIAELGKQYGASQPIADGKPVPFETWAEPMLRAAGLGQPARVPNNQTGAFVDQPNASASAAPSFAQYAQQIRARNPGQTLTDEALKAEYASRYGKKGASE